MRTSNDVYKTLDGTLIEVNQNTQPPAGAKIWQGYDYNNQIWIFNGQEDKRTLEELRASMQK